MRQTIQKTIIKEILCSTKAHPSAEWVYERARETMPNISLGTVYRNLNNLVSDGNAIIIKTADNHVRYDAMTDEHAHFVCTECGGVIDIHESPIGQPLINKALVENQGFTIARSDLVFYGVCNECSKKH